MTQNKQNIGLDGTGGHIRHRIPGMCRWKREKGQFWLILIFMSLSFLLMEAALLFSDSMEHTLLEQRKDAYGEWQLAIDRISETEEELVRGLPGLEGAGGIWTVGDITNEEIRNATSLGGMDAEALRLSRLSLVEGRFPEAAGEAAIEASLLNKLGGRLGDELTLSVKAASTAKKPGPGTLDVSVTVCGIVKDYSAGWCIGNLPGVLVTEATAEQAGLPLPHQRADGPEASRPQYRLLLEGQGECETVREEVAALRLSTGTAKQNTYAYPEAEEGENNVESALRILRLSILGVNTLVLYVVVRYSVRSRRQEWSDLYALGASIGKLRSLLAREGLFFWGLSLCAGLGLAILSFAVLSWALPLLLDMKLYFVFSLENLALAGLLGTVSAFLSYLAPALGIRRLAGEERARRGKRFVHSAKNSRRKAPTRTDIWLRGWRARPLGAAAQLLFLCALLLLPCIGVGMIWEKAQLLPSYQQRMGGSYVWDGHDLSVSKDKVGRLGAIYGVEEVRAWHRYGSNIAGDTEGYEVAVDLSDWQEDSYVQLAFQAKKDEQHAYTLDMEEWLEEAKAEWAEDESYMQLLEDDRQESLSREADLDKGYFPIVLMGTSSEAEIQRCLRNLAEESLDEAAFCRG